MNTPDACDALPTPAQIAERFARDGYALIPGLVAGPQLAALQADFDRIVAQLHASGEAIDASWKTEANTSAVSGGAQIVHTHQVQAYSAAWGRFLFDERWLDYAAACLGSEHIVLHHSKLFQKPAERGASFPPHQDWVYFPVRGDRMIAAILHLSEADDEMGCLRIWPGSHRHGRLGEQATLDDRFAQQFSEQFPLSASVPCVAKPGDMLFFHYHTVHASRPNLSQRIRKTTLLQLMAGDEVLEHPYAHPLAKLVLRGWSSTMTRALAGHV